MEVMTTSKLIFDTFEQLEEFYRSQLPTAKKFINALKCDLRNGAERAVFNHLTGYIKSLSKDSLMATFYNS